MSTLRFRDGDVTVTLGGELEAFARAALDAAGGELVRRLEVEMEAVAAEARASWYGAEGVERETGKSGDIQVVTTIDGDEVRVSVGSTDSRSAGKTGKPLVAFVHRRGPLSLDKVAVAHKDYWATPRSRRLDYPFVLVASDKARDGAFLVQEFVRKPAKARLRAITPRLGQLIAARIRGAR